MRNIIKYNDELQWTNKLSHFILERWCWLCERWAGDRERLLYWPQVLLVIAALLSHLGWVAQPWVNEGPKPSVCRWLSRWFSCWHLVPNWLTQSVCGLYYCLSSTCFRCFSDRGSICYNSIFSRFVTNIGNIVIIINFRIKKTLNLSRTCLCNNSHIGYSSLIPLTAMITVTVNKPLSMMC